MILYFDNLITDIPLFPGVYTELDSVRGSDSNYKFQDRLKITMYTLASYAELKWSNVIIKYELDPKDEKQKKVFEKFVKSLWPRAKIIYGRSDDIHKFREIAKIINGFKDDWIFYAGNNDHPFISPNKKNIDKCLKKAKELAKKYEYVSIVYSHFPEPLHMARSGTTLHDIGFPSSSILEETEDFVVGNFPQEYFTSIQIINKNLLNRWLFSKDLSPEIETATVKRIESVYPFIKKENRVHQIVVLPKEELCAHFDGYSQSRGTGYFVPSDLVPPLFIPPGFFEKNIKIAYGYDDYREGWVNINPLKPNFSFRGKANGTDLKITLDDLPLFWKKRIKRIDVNPKVSLKDFEKSRNLRMEKIRNLYLTKNGNNPIYYGLVVSQFRMRNLIKRIASTVPYLKDMIRSIERKYQIKL